MQDGPAKMKTPAGRRWSISVLTTPAETNLTANLNSNLTTQPFGGLRGRQGQGRPRGSTASFGGFFFHKKKKKEPLKEAGLGRSDERPAGGFLPGRPA